MSDDKRRAFTGHTFTCTLLDGDGVELLTWANDLNAQLRDQAAASKLDGVARMTPDELREAQRCGLVGEA